MESEVNQGPSGSIMLTLLVALVISLPFCFLLIRTYKAAVIRGMGFTSERFKTKTVKEPSVSNPNKREFKVFVQDTHSHLLGTSTVFLKFKEMLSYHWLIYGTMCLVFSATMSFFFYQSANLPFSLWKISYSLVDFFFPFFPLSYVLLARSFRDTLVHIGIFLSFYFTVSFIIYLASPEITLFQAFVPIFYYNIFPLLIFVFFRLRKIKAVGLFIYVFFLCVFFAPFILFYKFSRDTPMLEQVGSVFINMGFSGRESLIILFLLPAFLGVLFGWYMIKLFKLLYLKKYINDIQFNADIIIILFNISYSIFISFNSFEYGLLSLLSFPIYKFTGFVLFHLLKYTSNRGSSQQLLLLRVFALGKDSRDLFDQVLKYWRYAGSLHLITGPDLATSTIDPHEIISFITGNLKNSFCEDEESITSNIAKADLLSDQDGTYRVNEYFCRENNWKTVLYRLLEQSNLVLMDLRSFSHQNQGCKYEVEALISFFPITKMVFIVDKNTDLPFTVSVFKEAILKTDENSPNYLSPESITLNMVHGRHDDSIYIINLLSSKI